MATTWSAKPRLLTAAGGLVVLSVAAVAAFLASEWTYIEHLRHYPAKPITDVDWYQPKQAVAGGIPSDFPAPMPGQIAPQAISNAVRYAEGKHSAGLIVLHRGNLVLEKYWGIQTTARWTDSASMVKTITALLIGIAIDEGKIPSIDERAARFLPEWGKDARRDITIGHLLSMHSGLRPDGEYEDPFSDACYLALGTDLRYVVRNIPPVANPGVTNDYNNVNYQALGFILEAATGQSYVSYLSEKLWQPLGNAEAALWLDKKGGSARTFGYLFATPRDWARVGLLWLNGGQWNGRQVVSANWLRRMSQASPTAPEYGYGIWIGRGRDLRRNDREEPFDAEDVVYLDGRHKQRVYVVPSRQMVIVRVGEQARDWDEAYLVNALIRGAAESSLAATIEKLLQGRTLQSLGFRDIAELKPEQRRQVVAAICDAGPPKTAQLGFLRDLSNQKLLTDPRIIGPLVGVLERAAPQPPATQAAAWADLSKENFYDITLALQILRQLTRRDCGDAVGQGREKNPQAVRDMVAWWSEWWRKNRNTHPLVDLKSRRNSGDASKSST